MGRNGGKASKLLPGGSGSTLCPHEQIGFGPGNCRTIQEERNYLVLLGPLIFLSHAAFRWKKGWAVYKMWDAVIYMETSRSTLSLPKSSLSSSLFKVLLLVLRFKEKGGLTYECRPWSALQAMCCHYLQHPSLLDSVAAIHPRLPSAGVMSAL